MERHYLAENKQLCREWSDQNGFSPEGITSGSGKKVWWKGKCGHEWQSSVKNRCNGAGCPYCSGNKVLEGFNDLASNYPDLAMEWSEKNMPLLPGNVSVKSNKAVWWQCSRGHEWQARIADRTDGHGCPYCAGKILKGYNDLFSARPDLKEEWSDKNSIDPTTITVKSLEFVWWKCKQCGQEWQARVATKVKGTQCPVCREKMTQEHYREFLFRKREKCALRYRVPSLALCYYLTRGNIRYLKDDDSLFGIPIQIYLPDYKTAIETTTSKKESKKGRRNASVLNLLCFRTRIRMIRIIPPGGTVYEDCFCIRRLDETPQGLTEAIQTVFSVLHLEIDVDVERDITEIMRFQ